MVYSKILELINGIPRTVDLSTNTFSVQGLQINAATGGGAITLAAHSTTTTYSITWPQAQAAGSNYVLANDGSGNLSWIASSSGSVTAVSVNTANGFAGTSSGGTTPALTLTTTLTTPVIAGNGTALIAATTTGTGSTVVLDTNATLVSPALGTPTALVGTNITGTASGLTAGNINATSNSTLTTLSALSLPTSQLTGTISAAQMLPLATNDIYVGNGSNQPAAVTMSGDATIASGGALTLATVNSNVGSFGSSTSIPSITVNAKGLITAASGNAVVAPAGTLSGTTLNSTVVTSSLTSLGIQSAALNMGSNKITALATPTVSTDAATKGYVDAAISGLTWQGPAQAYSNADVPLTGGATLTIDGYSVQNGDLVLLANQTTASQNGEYSVSGIGTAYVLTSNGLPNAAGDAWLVQNGTVFKDSAFVANAAIPAATFTEFAGPTAYTFSPPLSLSGSTVSITQSNTSTNGYLSATDWNTFNNKQPAGNYITALTGDATASGPGSVALTLATVNSNVGTFASVTVNGKGLVTAAAALSGDATTSGSTITFATVNSNVGSFGSSTSIPTFTVNAKGLITAASGNAVVAPAGTLSGTTLNATVISSSLTSVGTIGTGTWQGTAIAEIYGGTNQTSYTTGDTLYASATNTLSKLPIGTTGQVLTVSGGIPAWAAPAASTGITAILTAGQNFTSTNTTYVVRWGLTANSETANRIYACDTTTSSFDLFYAIGTISVGASTLTTGSTTTVTKSGSITLGSSDPSLTAVGSPVYLAAGGALTQTAPSSSGTAVTRVGILSTTTTVDVEPVAVGIN